ncbi:MULTISPECIES: DNA modification methylase [Bacteria]
MKSRRLASLALVAAVLVGTSGCALIAPQATLIPYAPADGVSAKTGDVAVRNALVVSDDGIDGNFLAAFVNESTDPVTLRVEYGEGSDKTELTVRLAASEAISLGMDGENDPLPFPNIDTIPGATMPVYFQAGDAEGSLVEVPILTGETSYLEQFVP